MVVAADNLVDDIFPVAGDGLVEEATVVHGLKRSNVGRAGYGSGNVL